MLDENVKGLAVDMVRGGHLLSEDNWLSFPSSLHMEFFR